MYVMQMTIKTGKENTTLDVFKFAASMLIVASHLPSVFSAEIAELYFKQWYFRFCVPFFFIATGFFFYKSKNKGLYLKRVFWLFALSYLLYLPAILEDAGTLAEAISRLRWNLVVGYEHLWYLSALLEGLLIWYVLEKIPVINGLFRRAGLVVSVLLILIGALLDEHYHLLDNTFLTAAGDFLLNFGGPRNVIFMGFPLLVLGGAAARWEKELQRIPLVVLILAWVVLRGFAFLECGYLLRGVGSGIDTDLTFFGCWPGLVLFLISARFQIPIPEDSAKLLRKLSEYVYVFHPMVAQQIANCFSLTPQVLFFATIAICCALYVLLEKQFIVKK